MRAAPPIEEAYEARLRTPQLSFFHIAHKSEEAEADVNKCSGAKVLKETRGLQVGGGIETRSPC